MRYRDCTSLSGTHKVCPRISLRKRLSSTTYSLLDIFETMGSLIESWLHKSIHLFAIKGFELEIGLFVLAVSVNLLY